MSLDNFIDFSNININDFISIYLIDKNILNIEELNYFPFILFTNYYIFDENLKSKLTILINSIKSNINDFNENEIIDYTKCSIINSICSNNPTCLCPIFYKNKINLNYKINNQNNIIKKIIIAGKSFETRLQIHDDYLNSIKIQKNYNKFLMFIFLSIISFIYINFYLKIK